MSIEKAPEVSTSKMGSEKHKSKPDKKHKSTNGEKKRKRDHGEDGHKSKSKKHKSDKAASQASALDVTAPASPFHIQTASLYLPLAPVSQKYPLEGLCAEHISPLILTYYPPFNGVVLSYSDPRLSEKPFKDDGESVLLQNIDEYAVSWAWLTAEFLLFKPEKDALLEGYVNLQNPGHLGIVCWNLFNASIESKRLPSDWKWKDVSELRNKEGIEAGETYAEEGPGFWVDGEGNKVEGIVKFRVREIESSHDRERGFLSIEGTMLSKADEDELVQSEREGARSTRDSAGRLLGGSRALGATSLGVAVEADMMTIDPDAKTERHRQGNIVPSLGCTVTMAVLIKLQNEKAGVNNDAAFTSGGEIVKEILCQWSIPYALPTGLNQEPAEEPVIIGYTFLGGEGSVGVIPYGNGFVTALIRAYHQGLHLRLAPEDVWLSILSQLRAYAYRHPSSIPGFSSSLDLNVELTINLDSDLETSDSTPLDEKFSGLANIVVNDDDLRDWFTPNFSTTNTTDKAVASIVMIGGLRKSTEPDHDIHQRAGLSSINLLGEKSDWEEILRRVEGRIPSFGEEAVQWCKILVPVIQGMISSFDSPNLAQTKEFWHKACHFDGTDLRNDKETMTGWITAFCFWSDSGYCLHPSLIKEGTLHHPRRRISFDEFGYGDEPQIFWEDDKDDWYATKLTDRKEIFTGGEKCHRIFPKNIPSGTATAVAYVRDYYNRRVYSVTIVAGSMGAIPTEVGYFSDETVLQPSSGWFLLQDEVKAMQPPQQLPTLIEDGHEVFVLD